MSHRDTASNFKNVYTVSLDFGSEADGEGVARPERNSNEGIANFPYRGTFLNIDISTSVLENVAQEKA